MGARAESVTPTVLSAALAARAATNRPVPSGPRIVAVDGPSGSGKTDLALRVAGALGAPCVHLDDFVPGWGGLAASVNLLVEWVLAPLAAGRAARWRRWDWAADTWAADTRACWRALPPSELVVVEGCGAGAGPARPWLSALVWMGTSATECQRRLRARADWPPYEPWAGVWARQELALRLDDDPSTTADAVITEEAEVGCGVIGVSWPR